MVNDGCNAEKSTLVTGYLHTCNLSANQLVCCSGFGYCLFWLLSSVTVHFFLSFLVESGSSVHVSGAGDFQLCKIELLKDSCPLNARKDGDFMDSDVHDVQVSFATLKYKRDESVSSSSNVAGYLVFGV